MTTPPPDFNRIAELNKRLDDICREAEEIRAKITAARTDAAPWPDRRHEARMFNDEASATPPRKPQPT